MNIIKSTTILLIFVFLFSKCEKYETIALTTFDYSAWKLVWNDEFEGNEIDFSKWSKTPRGKNDWDNYMSEYEGLYEVKNGNLILRGMANNVLPNDTASFLTGGIYTKGKKTFGLGRMEIRAKLNPATGAWPAIWMIPADVSWRIGGEIDIMERLNHEKGVFHTVHTNYVHNVSKTNPLWFSYTKLNPNEYNIYSVEKHQDRVDFFVNNIKTFTYKKISTEFENQFPFPHYNSILIIDMQLGGSWVGAINIKELPVEMHIDWVRFYEPTNQD